MKRFIIAPFLLALLLGFVSYDSGDSRTLYVKVAAIYAGEAKGYVIPRDTLEKYGDSFIRRPTLRDHAWSDTSKCVGRIIDAGIAEDEYGEYLELTLEITDAEAIEMITHGGRLHYMSVGFSLIRDVCSLDGAVDCLHIPGREYANSLTGKTETAYRIVMELLGQEVSFVNIPAYRWARVIEWSYKPLHYD